MNDIEIINNEDKRRFEAHVGQHLAELTYYYSEGSIVFTHTGVPDPISGQGLASRLAQTALDYAREQKLSVVPLCPFVAKYITRHPEYQDLVLKGPGQ